MSTALSYPDGFFLPKSDGAEYVDALAEAIQNSPEWIKEDISDLNEKLAERKQALAVAYTRPENDRRKPHDGPNVTMFEFACRVIEPTCEVRGKNAIWIRWESHETPNSWDSTRSQPTPQDAWRAAFAILDRRQNSEVPNV